MLLTLTLENWKIKKKVATCVAVLYKWWFHILFIMITDYPFIIILLWHCVFSEEFYFNAYIPKSPISMDLSAVLKFKNSFDLSCFTTLDEKLVCWHFHAAVFALLVGSVWGCSLPISVVKLHHNNDIQLDAAFITCTKKQTGTV